MAVGAAVVALAGLQVLPATASAQPDPQPEVEAQAPELLHNVTYRVRVDGVSRGATITYRGEGDQLQIATPTMVPGRIFEVMTVLPASGMANLRLSVDWPYSRRTCTARSWSTTRWWRRPTTSSHPGCCRSATIPTTAR